MKIKFSSASRALGVRRLRATKIWLWNVLVSLYHKGTTVF